ncbi:MAG: hypothetical protein HY861_03160 [Chlamydiia bacterium]|nr:hypothetical protein [Chlamydiia bacterium]
MSYVMPQNLQNLLDDAAAQEALQQQYESDKAAYKAKIEKLNAMHDGGLEMMFVMLEIMTSANPGDSANILGMQEDQLGIFGKGLQVQSDATNIMNDIQNTINATGETAPQAGDIDTVASKLDGYLDALGGNPNHPEYANQALITALGGQGSPEQQALITQLSAMRGTITEQTGDGSPNNDATDYNSLPGTKYFDSTGANNTITSFYQMQQEMQQPGSAGESATAASKILTDAGNSISSTTQSANAALNEEISQLTNFEKDVQSFYTAFLKSIIDGNNATIQNQLRT